MRREELSILTASRKIKTHPTPEITLNNRWTALYTTDDFSAPLDFINPMIPAAAKMPPPISPIADRSCAMHLVQ